MSTYALKFISGKYQGGELPLPTQAELLIGRSSDLDLVLVEDMVSRKHAKLVCGDGTLGIVDLGSTNGTFVNGEKIRSAELQRNDRILIGTSIIKVIDAQELATGNDAPPDRAAIRAMMEELAKRSQVTSTMSGDLEEVPLPDLLQLFATNKKSGVLTVTGAHRGQVYIKDGQLEHCAIVTAPHLPPMKAICRMVDWSRGSFRLEPYDEGVKLQHTFQEPTESILIEALRQLDEMRRLLPKLPHKEARLALCVPLSPKLSALEPSELDVLQAVVNFGSFATVVDRFPGTDHEVITAVAKLLRDGFIEVG